MSDIRVVGVGSALLDILVRLERMPTWEDPVDLLDLEIDGGGPVATAMVAVERLGIHAGMVGTYGTHRVGQIKLQTLAEHGVDVSRMVPRAGVDTMACIAYIDAATGERVFSALHNLAHDQLSLDELDRDYITATDYLHLDGGQPDAALQAARWMRAAGKKVMLDGGATHGSWAIAPIMRALVSETDVLICGSGFGPDLTGFTDLWDVGGTILDLGPSIVVQTEGKDGAYTTMRDEQFHTPSYAVDVVDTTAAATSFTARSSSRNCTAGTCVSRCSSPAPCRRSGPPNSAAAWGSPRRRKRWTADVSSAPAEGCISGKEPTGMSAVRHSAVRWRAV